MIAHYEFTFYQELSDILYDLRNIINILNILKLLVYVQVGTGILEKYLTSLRSLNRMSTLVSLEYTYNPQYPLGIYLKSLISLTYRYMLQLALES